MTDSLSGFALVLVPTFREALARMVSALTSTGVTVLMTSELEGHDTEWRFSPDATAFLTDAIIVPGYIALESRLQSMMAALKIRACAHSSGLRLFHDDDDGVMVDPMLSSDDGPPDSSRSRNPSGLKHRSGPAMNDRRRRRMSSW